MIIAAFNIAIYTVLIFLIGMYKPGWPLFFMKNPNRMTIMIITLVGIMVSATLFGEGTRQKKLALENAPVIQQSTESAVPVPTN